MFDGTDNSSLEPSRDNILTQIDLFVKDVRSGDFLLFILLGHGCQTINRSGSERDGKDEAIIASNHFGVPEDVDGVPLDTPTFEDRKAGRPHHKKYRGIIVDNELRERLVNPLPAGSQLLAFIETCHSETMLDLASPRWQRRYVKAMRKLSSKYNQVAKCIRRAKFCRLSSMDFTANPTDLILSMPIEASEGKRGNSYDQTYFLKSDRAYDHGDPWVVSFSSTKDDQVSWADEHTMISVVFEHLKDQRLAGRQLSVVELKEHVRDRLAELRLELLIAKRLVSKRFAAERRAQLQEVLEPQVSALDKLMLNTVLEI